MREREKKEGWKANRSKRVSTYLHAFEPPVQCTWYTRTSLSAGKKVGEHKNPYIRVNKHARPLESVIIISIHIDIHTYILYI